MNISSTVNSCLYYNPFHTPYKHDRENMAAKEYAMKDVLWDTKPKRPPKEQTWMMKPEQIYRFLQRALKCTTILTECFWSGVVSPFQVNKEQDTKGSPNTAYELTKPTVQLQ